MKHADIKAMMAEIAPVIREFADKSIAPLVARLDAIDARFSGLPAPKEYDPEASARLVVGETVLPRMKAIEDGLPDIGASLAPLLKRVEELEAKPVPQPEVVKADLTAIVADVESLRKAVGEWKEPEPVVVPDVQAIVAEAIGKLQIPDAIDLQALGKMVDDAVAAIPPAQPGKDADPEEMRREIAEQVKAAVGAIPVPKDGDSVTVDDVRPLIEEQVAKIAAGIRIPKDGADVVGGTIDRDGHLIITLSNGQTKDFGLVVGKDAEEVDWAQIDHRLKAMFDAWPKPKDALAVDDMDEELRDGGRIIVHRYRRGNDCIEFEHKTAFQIYRGVFKEGATYERGDTVTWGGSQWHCDEPSTTEKPDSPAKHWTLSTKRGRDGKDAGPTKPVKI